MFKRADNLTTALPENVDGADGEDLVENVPMYMNIRQPVTATDDQWFAMFDDIVE